MRITIGITLLTATLLLCNSCKQAHSEELFSLCQPIEQLNLYPHRSLEYKGHQRQIRKVIEQNFDANNSIDYTGFINVKFYINCKGEKGNVKIDGLGLNYKTINVSGQLQAQINNLVQALEDWILPFDKEGVRLDSTYSFVLKIENGKLTNVIL